MDQRWPLSVTIITRDEEKNIARAIQSVQWADDILVVDSGSQDQTREIAARLGARVLENAWQGYGQQKNFAQRNARHDWILSLDADEEVSSGLAREIQGILGKARQGDAPHHGYYLPRKTFYLGKWIMHGGWYPNHLIRLSDRRFSRWSEPAVHEACEVQGSVGTLQHPLLHYTFSDIQDQILTNLRFSKLGSRELQKRGQKASVLKLVLKPIGKFVETYFLKGGFLDGLPGFIISVNAAHSMFLKYAYLFETEIKNESADHR